MVAPIRKGVVAAYEPALDRAFDAITAAMLKSKPKEEVAAFWQALAAPHPQLAAFIRTQVNLLMKGAGANLVANGDFSQGQEGNPPTIQGWRTGGAWEDIRADFAWPADSGRNGGRAAAIGRGYTGSLSASVPTQAGARYRATVWYKTNAPRGRLSASVGGAALDVPSIVGEWRRATATFTSPTSGVNFTLTANGLNKGEWAWFDDVEVVEICGK
jgi:hypothetical protein